MFLCSMRERIVKKQYIPKDDEEEQKELELSKQYDVFRGEADEVRKEMEGLLDKAEWEDGKVQ